MVNFEARDSRPTQNFLNNNNDSMTNVKILLFTFCKFLILLLFWALLCTCPRSVRVPGPTCRWNSCLCLQLQITIHIKNSDRKNHRKIQNTSPWKNFAKKSSRNWTIKINKRRDRINKRNIFAQNSKDNANFDGTTERTCLVSSKVQPL